MLEKISTELTQFISERARKYATASFLIKLIMVVGAAAVVSVSQFNEILNVKGQVNWWNVAGQIAAVVAFIGGLILLIIDGDAAKELSTAHDAIEHARKLERQWARSEIYYDLIAQSSALNQTYSIMRAAIEQSASDHETELNAKIEGLLASCHRQVEAAAQLKPGTDWTLCIFKANDENRLEIIADQRSSPCEKSNARSWPIGVGPAGVAYAQHNEVLLPDLFAPELGTTFSIPKELVRDHDRKRFRSIAAIPIMHGTKHDCWGVVIATVNRIGHFSQGRFDPDSIATDTIRSVAEMVGLLVELDDGKMETAPNTQSNPGE